MSPSVLGIHPLFVINGGERALSQTKILIPLFPLLSFVPLLSLIPPLSLVPLVQSLSAAAFTATATAHLLLRLQVHLHFVDVAAVGIVVDRLSLPCPPMRRGVVHPLLRACTEMHRHRNRHRHGRAIGYGHRCRVGSFVVKAPSPHRLTPLCTATTAVIGVHLANKIIITGTLHNMAVGSGGGGGDGVDAGTTTAVGNSIEVVAKCNAAVVVIATFGRLLPGGCNLPSRRGRRRRRVKYKRVA